MTKKIIKSVNDKHSERVKELLNEPVVKAHCELLDNKGIQYKIVPLIPKRMSA